MNCWKAVGRPGSQVWSSLKLPDEWKKTWVNIIRCSCETLHCKAWVLVNHDRQIMPSWSNVFRISSMEEFRKILQTLDFSECVSFCDGRHLTIGDFLYICRLESTSAIDQVKRLGMSSVQKNGKVMKNKGFRTKSDSSLGTQWLKNSKLIFRSLNFRFIKFLQLLHSHKTHQVHRSYSLYQILENQ